MKLIFILLPLLILTSCGLRLEQVKTLSIHPELQPYLADFEYYYGKEIDDLEMTFASSLEGSTLGYCQIGVTHKNKLDKTLVYKTPKIVIDKYVWDHILKPDEKRQLILHELGHCILKRNHDDSSSSVTLSNNTSSLVAKSLMNSYMIWTSELNTRTWSYWIKELFQTETLVADFNFNKGIVASSKMKDAEIIDEHLIVETQDCIHDKGITIENHDHDEYIQK